MNPILWFDFLVAAIVVVAFFDQIIIPLIRRRPIFPGFGKSRRMKKTVTKGEV